MNEEMVEVKVNDTNLKANPATFHSSQTMSLSQHSLLMSEMTIIEKWPWNWRIWDV
jgi:hypothetical protein